MTRRVPARSSIAPLDADAARTATIDLFDSAMAPEGLGRPRTVGDLARLLVPASVAADVPERAALGGWLRSLGRRGR
jgi:hypothetical protein